MLLPGLPTPGLIGRQATGGGFSFTNAEAAALVARMSVEPDDTRKGLIDTLVGDLKTDGVWSRLDALWIFASHDEQAGRLNWKSSTGDLTAPASQVFTTDVSYGGGSGQYFTTGIDVSNFTQFTLNDAHMTSWWATHSGAKSYGLYAGVNSRQYLDWYNDSLIFMSYRTNTSTTSSASANTTPKMFTWVRTSSSSVKNYVNGVGMANTLGSTSIETYNPQIGATLPMKVASLGASLNDAQAAALYSRVNTYLAAIAP